jgi:hypothetical protein
MLVLLILWTLIKDREIFKYNTVISILMQYW